LGAERLEALTAMIRAVGVTCAQLGLDPVASGVWPVTEVRAACDGAGIELRSGMMGMEGEDYSTLDSIRATGGIRPTRHWQRNLESAKACADAAQALGLDLVSFHAGFLPHDEHDPERELLLDRLRRLADVFAQRGVRVAFETGQETAQTLLRVLDELERETVGVNFDPANMILYAMGDPVEALRTLGQRVFQIHIKDAVGAEVPGQWGREVPVGTGAVDWGSFFGVLDELGLGCDLMIEREAGGERLADMRGARTLLESLHVVEVPA